MGKAVKRASLNLPISPRKRKAVVAVIAKSVGLNCAAVPKGSSKQELAKGTYDKVIEFYNRDEISWQAPDRKDHVILRSKTEDSQKKKLIVQTRYMLMSLAEAHQLFVSQNSTSVGLSKFCELHLKYVKLFDNIPHNVCVCSYHENV